METVAVIGASPLENRYSNKAIKMLSEYRHKPVPVAPKHKTIEGLKVYHSVDTIPDKIDTATLYLGPKRQEGVIEQLIKLKPKRVIFNPGTENQETKSKLEAAGINTIEACTLVLLKTNQFER